jgi:hypothetical protein
MYVSASFQPSNNSNHNHQPDWNFRKDPELESPTYMAPTKVVDLKIFAVLSF